MQNRERRAGTVRPVSDETESLIWIDGVLRPAAEATVPLLSHAVQRGSTVFDVLRVCETPDGPAAFGLRPHIARFDRSMSLMGMTSTWSLDRLERAVAETSLANPGANLVKVTAAWVSTPVSTIPDTTVPLVAVAALRAPLADPVDTPGIRVKTATGTKMPPDVLPPGLKVAAAYTSGIRQKMLARNEGYDDIVLRTTKGDLAEGVSQSLFVVRGDLVLLPPLDVVLDGITRRMILDMAHHLGFHSQIRGITWDEVEAADELFLCSTTNPVQPIRELDGRVLPDPGDHTARLAAESSVLLSGTHVLSPKWLTPLRPLA